jgi:hypothetical protein
MRGALVLVVLLAASPRAAAQPAFAGEFAIPGVLCDCDPADFVFRTTTPIDGHAEPDPASPVIRRVASRRLIEGNDWTEALTVVTRAARVVALADTVLADANVLGTARYDDLEQDAPTTTLSIARGDTLWYLAAYQGYAWFRHRGVLYGTAGGLPIDTFRIEEEPREVVWFRLTPRHGRPAAWVEIRYGGRADANVEMLCETHGGCVGR